MLTKSEEKLLEDWNNTRDPKEWARLAMQICPGMTKEHAEAAAQEALAGYRGHLSKGGDAG